MKNFHFVCWLQLCAISWHTVCVNVLFPHCLGIVCFPFPLCNMFDLLLEFSSGKGLTIFVLQKVVVGNDKMFPFPFLTLFISGQLKYEIHELLPYWVLSHDSQLHHQCQQIIWHCPKLLCFAFQLSFSQVLTDHSFLFALPIA